jgi:quinol monooxygenase YgiN
VAIAGVIAFDIGRDLTDPNVFIATEVYEDTAARERQAALPEVATLTSILPDCLGAAPQAIRYHVASSEPAI